MNESDFDKFDIGEPVFLKTDREQRRRIITAICSRADGVVYELSHSTTKSWHYDFEMSTEIDQVKKIMN